MKKERIKISTTILCIVIIFGTLVFNQNVYITGENKKDADSNEESPSNLTQENNKNSEAINDMPTNFNTPLQAALAQAFFIQAIMGEDIPKTRFIDYENGTSLTIIEYSDGSIIHITETFVITYETVEFKDIVTSNEDIADSITLDLKTVEGDSNADSSSITQDILLGFTLELPGFEWSIFIEDPIFGIDLLDMGVEFKFGLGLRLPISINLQYPSEMIFKHNYPFIATLTGENWNANEFSAAGLDANENEWLCSFLAHIWFKIIGFGVDVGPTFDESKSFTTPIGTGTTFPLGEIAVDLVKAITGVDISSYVGVEIVLEPILFSQKVTAQWIAEGDSSGSGTLTWSYSGQQLTFTVSADDLDATTHYSKIKLYNFKYYFTDFGINFRFRIDFRGFLNIIPDIDISLYYLDLSFIPGAIGLSVPVHGGSYTGPKQIVRNIFVEKYDLDLLITPFSRNVVPGEIGTYIVRVTNRGNVPDTFRLSLSGLPSTWWYEFSENDILLNPGASKDIVLRIKPYKHWSTSPGDYSFSVTGTSLKAAQHDLQITEKKYANVHVLPFYEFSSSISDDLTIIPGEINKFKIQIQNLGNVIDTYYLSYIFKDFGSIYQAFPTALQEKWFNNLIDSVTLAPGQKINIEISILIPENWTGFENTIYEMEVIVSTDNAPPQTLDISFLVISSMFNKLCYLDWQLEQLKSYINENLCCCLSRILNFKLTLAQRQLQEAYCLYENGKITCSLFHDAIAKVFLKIAEFKTEFLNKICFINDEHTEYITNSLHSIRNNIVIFMGCSVGTEDAYNIALIEVDLLNLNDFIEDEINWWNRLCLSSCISSAASKLEMAIFIISLDYDGECILKCAQYKLEKAKCKVQHLLDKGKISQELADILLFEIQEAIENIEALEKPT